MKKNIIYRFILFVLIHLVCAPFCLAQSDWMIYDITPGEPVNEMETYGGLIGIQVRITFSTVPPDSIVIKNITKQYDSFPGLGSVSSTGSSPVEESGMGGKMKAYWFVVEIAPNQSIYTSGDLSIGFSVYENGVESFRSFGYRQTIRQRTLLISPGTIGGDQTINTNAEAAMLEGTQAESYNGASSVSYAWYKDDGSGWQVIAGATQSFLYPGVLARTMRYKRTASDGWAMGESNVVQVTVRDPDAVQADDGRNYTVKFIPRNGSPVFAEDDAVANMATISYCDALGRPEQVIDVNGSPEGNDMVQPVVYDAFGRDDAITYLPYEASGPAGSYRTDWRGETDAFYGTLFYGSSALQAMPRTDRRYEVSGLDRVRSEQGPGDEFRTEGRAKTYLYDTNAENELLWFEYGSGVLYKGNYPARRLYKTRVEDEDRHVTEEFKNYAGNVILQRMYLTENTSADTYYVYDELDRLVCVLPPLAVGNLDAAPDSRLPDDFLAEYAYTYTYDGRDNIASKRIPGGVAETYAYNGSNQPVWKTHSYAGGTENTLYEYDGLNRIVCEIHTVVKPNPIPEGPVAVDVVDTMAVYRYDTYPQLSWAAFAPVSGVATGYDARVKGLKTYEKLRILDFSREQAWTYDRSAAPCVERVFYYDDKGRTLQVVERRGEGAVNRYTTRYDWLGNVLVSYETHADASNPEAGVSIRSENSYDHRNRLMTTVTSVNGQEYVTSVQQYNRLGQPAKRIYSGGSVSLSDTTEYNIRGWITRIAGDEFDIGLAYAGPVYASASYTGNISEISWLHRGESRHTYAFDYDELSRLTNTDHYAGSVKSDTFTEKNIGYDPAGNILALERHALADETTRLTYCYAGNRLTALDEVSTRTDGGTLRVSHGYRYDELGNMTRDGRNNLDLQYNFLNLIVRACDTLGNPVASYAYDWSGTKWSVRGADGETGLDYAGSLVYDVRNGRRRVESIAFPGGRLVAANGGFEPRFFLTDHLGSVRAVIDGGGNVDERNDYFPFGQRWNAGVLSENRYRYNGKEEQEFVNMPYVDYGARMYDPQLGRWFNADPLAEKYHAVSPYAYCDSNPVVRIDPDGEIWDTIWDVLNLVYDVGAAGYNHIKGDHETAKSHWIDAGTDLVATLVPFVPAGATKVLKTADKVADAVKTADKVGDAVKAADKVGDATKAVEKTANSSRAARREAMREQGIPTSKQPVSQSRNASGREYSYEVPTEGGGKQIKSVQQQTLDRSHTNQPHWEAGPVKADRWGAPQMNNYGRPKLKGDKSKVNY